METILIIHCYNKTVSTIIERRQRAPFYSMINRLTSRRSLEEILLYLELDQRPKRVELLDNLTHLMTIPRRLELETNMKISLWMNQEVTKSDLLGAEAYRLLAT